MISSMQLIEATVSSFVGTMVGLVELPSSLDDLPSSLDEVLASLVTEDVGEVVVVPLLFL